MKCEKCGGPIGNNITRINGHTICENCARSMGIDMAFNSPISRAFPILNELTNAIMASGSDLEFTSTKITCPRCGTTLKEIETTGNAGCIECYNFFNDVLVKSMLKLQGSNEYIGRKPGQKATFVDEISSNNEGNKENNEETTGNKAEATERKADNKATETNTSDKSSKTPEVKDKKSLYEKLMKADLGMVPDDELEDAMRQAAANEDYAFAAKLRDELKSRKGGEN